MHAAARLLSPYAQEPPWPSKVHGRAAHPASSVDRRRTRAVPAGAGAREGGAAGENHTGAACTAALPRSAEVPRRP